MQVGLRDAHGTLALRPGVLGVEARATPVGGLAIRDVAQAAMGVIALDDVVVVEVVHVREHDVARQVVA
ncbi:hypothetical protein D3C86_2242980 [compost metagenome]